MDDVIYLLRPEETRDEYGVQKTTYTERMVYCRVNSVSRSEFFAGGRNGLNPTHQFTVFSGDYCGETALLYRGESYAIYRTYLVPGSDYMELYTERKGGTNGLKDGDKVYHD